MVEKKKPDFKRRTWHKYSKLGKGRKKKQIWRRPTGRDNKMREKRAGRPAVVSIGYSRKKTEQGKLKEKAPIKIMNAKDLEKMEKNSIAVIGNIGKKKKIEIANKAKEMKIEIYNMNTKTFLKKNKIKKKKVENKKKESKEKVKENKENKQ